jgi:hypothetical protein
MNSPSFIKLLFLFQLFSIGLIAQSILNKPFDIVVYGGTSAGVIAAVQSARMGHSVLLIEPGNHLGGLSAGGLGATDIGNKDAIGGLSREFYQRVYTHYNNTPFSDNSMWTFEPHVAEKIFNDFILENNIPVIFNERIDLKHNVKKVDGRISEIQMESGKTIRGKMFIDATYEGDLMAKAGVSYTFGRESKDKYNETLNGVQTQHAIYHNFKHPVDPYTIPGDPNSGLLPGIQNDGARIGRERRSSYSRLLFSHVFNQYPGKQDSLSKTRSIRSNAVRIVTSLFKYRCI